MDGCGVKCGNVVHAQKKLPFCLFAYMFGKVPQRMRETEKDATDWLWPVNWIWKVDSLEARMSELSVFCVNR